MNGCAEIIGETQRFELDLIFGEKSVKNKKTEKQKSVPLFKFGKLTISFTFICFYSSHCKFKVTETLKHNSWVLWCSRKTLKYYQFYFQLKVQKPLDFVEISSRCLWIFVLAKEKEGKLKGTHNTDLFSHQSFEVLKAKGGYV